MWLYKNVYFNLLHYSNYQSYNRDIFRSSYLCLLVLIYLYDFVELLRILIYHDGQFLGGWRQIYVGGKVDKIRNINPNFTSSIKIRNAVLALGYLQTGDLWYTFDEEDWLAIRTLKNGKDVIDLINRSFKKKRCVLKNVNVDEGLGGSVYEDRGFEVEEDLGVGGSNLHEVEKDVAREPKPDLGKVQKDLGES